MTICQRKLAKCSQPFEGAARTSMQHLWRAEVSKTCSWRACALQVTVGPALPVDNCIIVTCLISKGTVSYELQYIPFSTFLENDLTANQLLAASPRSYQNFVRSRVHHLRKSTTFSQKSRSMRGWTVRSVLISRDRVAHFRLV